MSKTQCFSIYFSFIALHHTIVIDKINVGYSIANFRSSSSIKQQYT